MTYRTHTIAGAAAAAATAVVIDAPMLELPALFAVALFAALAPDIDHRGSWIARRLPGLHVLYRAGLSNPLTRLLIGRKRSARLVSHRGGIAHSLLGALASAVLVVLAVDLLLAEWPTGHAWLRTRAGTPVLPAAVAAVPVPPRATAAGLFWLAGYASHLLLDLLTPHGVRLLYPLSRRRLRLRP